jgi:hypothetical protein
MLAAAGLLATGVAAGAIIGATTLSGAATTSTTTPTAPTSTFHGNEDATHEAGESAAREAAENNGTATYGPGSSATAGG